MTEEELDDLFDAICEGDRDTVVSLVETAINNKDDVSVLLNEAMIPAMGEVGNRFSENIIFVPEMLVAARAMQGGINLIEPILASSGHEPIAKVAVGSVKGDLHDIGKNLVIMMLKGAGFQVEDLGVDVDIPMFEEAVNNGYKILCLSALLTTTKDEMRTVINHFKDWKNVKIVIGGAVITQEFADIIGANAFGADASEAVKAVHSCIAA
ncbi:MAG: cobalamin-binding protein [Gammaproteobacteria bacterium]|nr:cobalamin-binding protein [Gammaproteobacteria bacterium]